MAGRTRSRAMRTRSPPRCGGPSSLVGVQVQPGEQGLESRVCPQGREQKRALDPVDRAGTLLERALQQVHRPIVLAQPGDRSEEHTSELKSPYVISYGVFCLKK